MDLILQEDYIFNFIYLKQEEGWQLERTAIIIYTNFFSTQREHKGIIIFSDSITDTI